MALAGRTDDDSDEADRAFVGAVVLASLAHDIRLIRESLVKTS